MFSRRPLFAVFGIPVSIDPMFFLGLFIFYQFAGGGRAGALTAIGIGVFTLIHELGHATTARSLGCEVAISLNFLVGWAHYAPSRPLSSWQRAFISFMGPFTQLATAVATLFLVRQWLISPSSTRDDIALYVDIHYAVMFAGIVLAALNLLPLWPLDGGTIVTSLVPGLSKPAGRTAFLQWTIGASVLVLMANFVPNAVSQSVSDWVSTAIARSVFQALPQSVLIGLGVGGSFMLAGSFLIPIFCGLSAWQALKSPLNRGAQIDEAGTPGPGRKAVETEKEAHIAERQGWSTGAPAAFPRGWAASPWLRSHVALRNGSPPDVVTAELASLGDTSRRWWVDRWDRPEIGALLDYVPPSALHTPAVVEARKFHGPPQQLIDAAVATFTGPLAAEAYYAVAEGMAQRGLGDEAINWLTGAVERAPDPKRISTSRLLRSLHGRSEFQQLLGAAERAVASPRH